MSPTWDIIVFLNRLQVPADQTKLNGPRYRKKTNTKDVEFGEIVSLVVKHMTCHLYTPIDRVRKPKNRYL